MLYLVIAAIVFVVSSFIVYQTTYKSWIVERPKEAKVFKAQYLMVVFACGFFFTTLVMFLIKAARG